ncbi:MAG: FlgK family flagellar hook-associated protein, partial [Gammaproteobacteria bacterium]
QQNGAVNVFIGKGQALVMGTDAQRLTTVASELDPDKREIALVTPGGVQIITRDLTGGELGGTLRFREELLDPAQQQLGLVAAGLAMEFNALHQDGFDLNGDAGEAFFVFANGDMPVLHASTNTGNAIVTASYENPTEASGAKLDFSDFKLSFSGGSYTLTRLRDNQVINLDAVETPPASNIFDLQFSAVQPPELDIGELPGFTITVDLNGGGIVDGDDFLIRPAFSAAEKIALNVDDPARIAAATNVETDPATGEPVLDGMGNPVIIAGPMPGDNRNALRLANLENKMGLLGGTASFQDVYGQMVAHVGTLTRNAQVNASAQETLLNQAIDARESISGVNLDEEAANLIKFQQAYQAAAQVIAVTGVLFETLIGAFRR